MSGKTHEFAARLVWSNRSGAGTADYAGYDREYRVLVSGKPELTGSADAMFRGEASKHNPEDLFLVAISSCHMLSYLALCARNGVRVTAYEDDVRGTLALTPDGGGKFEIVTLRPRVTVADADTTDKAMQLHETAHQVCFIANSCSVPIHHHATIEVGT